MSRQTQINSKSKDHELTVHDHQTDSPLLPIPQIERLHAIRPDKVDWVFEQTESEALARRKEAHRVNTFIFFERILGVVFAFLLGAGGLAGSIWLAGQGKEIAASAIGGVTLVSLVSAFIYSGKRKE